MIRFLLWLYPARWRTRYGDEFELILADRPLGPFDAADILLGAIDAHLHLRGLGAASSHAKGVPMSMRLGALAAISGGLLWLIGLSLAFIGHDTNLAGIAFILVACGDVALLVALAGLSGFQSRRHSSATWVAVGLPAIGLVVMVIGIWSVGVLPDEPFLAGMAPWAVMVLGWVASVAGTLVFAVITLRTGALPRSGTLLLAAMSALTLSGVLVGSGLVSAPDWLQPVLLMAFPLGWVVLGWQAVRADSVSLQPAG